MSAGRSRANLADLQAAHKGGDAVRVASALLGAPPRTLVGRASYKGHTVDEVFAEYPSSWLGASADSRYSMKGDDLQGETFRLAVELYPDDEMTHPIHLAVLHVAAGLPAVTPLEKVVARIYSGVVRDMGGRHVVRKSTATSMKVRPRNYGPASEVVTTDADGNRWSEDGRLLSDKKAAKKLRKLVKED